MKKVKISAAILAVVFAAASAFTPAPSAKRVGEYYRSFDPTTQVLQTPHLTQITCDVDLNSNCANLYNSSNVLQQTIKGIFVTGS